MGYTVRRPFPRLHLFLHPPTRDLEGTEPRMLFLPTTGLSLPTQQVSLAQRGSSARRQYLVVVLVLLIAPSWRSSSTRMLPQICTQNIMLLACVYVHTATNKTYPVVSPWRSSSTSCSQGSRSTSGTSVYTQHTKETTHSCSYACMSTRRQAARTRLCHSWRSSITCRSQHIMETAHSGSHARMRTRRQAKGTRWCRRGGAAAHAAPASVLITSRR